MIILYSRISTEIIQKVKSPNVWHTAVEFVTVMNNATNTIYKYKNNI